jgi:hypothetical protein
MGKGSISGGRGDLHELMDVGKLLIEPSIRDSGTAQNTLVGKALTGGAGGAAALGAIDPTTAAMGAAATYGPTVAYRLAMGAGNYLRPREVGPALEAALPKISPADYAAILGARMQPAPAKDPEKKAERLSPRALAAALSLLQQ